MFYGGTNVVALLYIGCTVGLAEDVGSYAAKGIPMGNPRWEVASFEKQNR